MISQRIIITLLTFVQTAALRSMLLGLCPINARAGRTANLLTTPFLFNDEADTLRIDTNNRLLLPIFPLRKTVKLPTEELTLNLYEKRYIAMADYILEENHAGKAFGALYVSNKPHMIRNGSGPIVPIIEPGDIGTLFKLVHHEERYVVSKEGGESRRWVRLVGRGDTRFRVSRILHTGYQRDEDCNIMEPIAFYPFILAEVELIKDYDVTINSTLPCLFDPFSLCLRNSNDPRRDIGYPPSKSELESFSLGSKIMHEASIKRRLQVMHMRSYEEEWRPSPSGIFFQATVAK